MSDDVENTGVSPASANDAAVDPRAPRFGQAITASLLLGGVGLWDPAFVYAVAAILGLALFSRWRIDLYAIVWRSVVGKVVDHRGEREPAAPHRFAKLLGASGSIAASALLVAGLSTVGFAVAAVVGLLAAFGAVTGICLGCRMYRQVSFLRRRDVL